MNARQRTWLAACLFVIGAALAAVALQWDARLGCDRGVQAVAFFSTKDPWAEFGRRVEPPECQFGPGGEWLEHGIYVRRGWSADALLWGGLLPLVLFAAAGFVALGRGEKRA